MEKNLKTLFGLLFVAVWILAIVIGFNKGKKKASEQEVTLIEDILPLSREEKTGADKVLLDPAPVLSGLSSEALEPRLYSLKNLSVKEDLSIISEKGDELSPGASDRLSMDLFAFSIFDNDLKNEDDLKKEIRFDLEEKGAEEHYRGIEEAPAGKARTNRPVPEKKPGVKKAESVIFTNLK